jgi:hypothetical protein
MSEIETLNYKSIISKKLLNVINYLLNLDIQKNEINNEDYIKLINEEKEFYNKKLYEYSILYTNI